MEGIIKTSLLGLFFGTFGTTIGGIIGVNVKDSSNKMLSSILSFAAGLMLAIVSFELVPEATEKSGILFTIVGILLGIITMVYCDIKAKNKLENRNISNSMLKTGIIICIGLAIHNIPEGLAIGTGFESSMRFGYSLAIAIAIHDIPEGIFQSRLYENNLEAV